jgi:hypothetical protein
MRTSILQYKGSWTYGPYALGGTVVVAVSLAKSTSSVAVTLGSAAAAVVGAAGVSITEAALLTTTGEANLLYVVSDGENRGAKLVWAVPEGESVATWCWWLWPQASYF